MQQRLLGWDELDDFQQLCSLTEFEVERIKRIYSQLVYLRGCFEQHLDFINVAPAFFCEVMDALECRVVVGTTRFFDTPNNSKSLSLQGILDKARKKYLDNKRLQDFVEKSLANLHDVQITDIKTLRDKYYAHLDEAAFSNMGTTLDLSEILSLLNVAEDILRGLFDCFDLLLPPPTQQINDLEKLIKRLYEIKSQPNTGTIE